MTSNTEVPMDFPRHAPSYPPTGPHVTFPESAPRFLPQLPEPDDSCPDAGAEDAFEDFVPRWWPESGPDAK
jgi:hypothetical protein